MKKIIIIISSIFLSILLIIHIFFPWTELNCEHQDMDLITGKIRIQKYFLYIKYYEKIKKTELSNIIETDINYVKSKPVWVRVNTFSPGINYSPHYIYHSVLVQTEELKLLWELPNFPNKLKKFSGKKLLYLLQKYKTGSGINNYLLELTNIIFDSKFENDEIEEFIQNYE